MKLFARDEFNKSIERHDALDYVVRFSFKSQFVAMLYGPFAGSAGLREIEAGLGSHANRLHAMHCTPPRRSTLADANHDRPAAIFNDLPGVTI